MHELDKRLLKVMKGEIPKAQTLIDQTIQEYEHVFLDFSFLPLYRVLENYNSFLDRLIDIARKELGDGENSEVERLQGIKEDVEVCLKALIDNGSWKE